MSYQVAANALTGAAVGTAGTVDWSAYTTSPPPSGDPASAQVPHLALYNESGCGLLVSLPGSGTSFSLPAGAWRIIPVGRAVTQLTYSVQYVIIGARVSTLFVDFFPAGETPPDPGTLGNSPVVGSNPDRVINDGESYTQQVVEATPLGAFQSTLLMANSGTVKLAAYIATIYTPYMQVISSADGVAQIVFGGTETPGYPPQFIGRFYATISPKSSLVFQVSNPTDNYDLFDVYNDGTWNAWVHTLGVKAQYITVAPGAGTNPGTILIGNAVEDTVFSGALGAGPTPAVVASPYTGATASYTFFPARPISGALVAGGAGFGTQSAATTFLPLFIGSASEGSSYSTIIGDSGALSKVAGQATAGVFGVPVVVWVVKDWHISGAGTFTQTFTAPTTGIYRISGRIQMNNGTASSVAVNIYVQYTDGQSGVTEYVHCSATNSSGTFLVLTAGVTIPMNGFGGFYHMTPAAMEIKANTVVTFTYVIPNTPNDYISFVLEQLA